MVIHDLGGRSHQVTHLVTHLGTHLGTVEQGDGIICVLVRSWLGLVL